MRRKEICVGGCVERLKKGTGIRLFFKYTPRARVRVHWRSVRPEKKWADGLKEILIEKLGHREKEKKTDEPKKKKKNQPKI